WFVEVICFIHYYCYSVVFFFFFQAEDGIRDDLVTGVQTCALPICQKTRHSFGAGSIHPAGGAAGSAEAVGPDVFRSQLRVPAGKIGRASCRERVEVAGGAVVVERRRIM